MGILNIFCFRTKKVSALKATLIIAVFSSVYLVKQKMGEFVSVQESAPPEDIVRILEVRRASLQLNWLSNKEDTSITRKEISNEHQESFEVETSKVQKGNKFNEDKTYNYLIYNKQVDLELKRNATESNNARITELRKGGWLPTLQTQTSNAFYIKEDLNRRRKEVKQWRRKYLFALRYYEQLAGATKNLIDFAALGKHFNREIVMPFVNNSRMNGIPFKTMQKALKYTFSNLSRYFDIKHLNSTLAERGYAPLAHFHDFINDCKSGLDAVVHFVYNDTFSANDAKNWFGVSPKRWDEIRKQLVVNGGFGDCEFLRKSGIERLLGGVAVKKYVCIDPEIIRTAKEIEHAVFKEQRCIGIIQWKGTGNRRTHFPVPKSVFQQLRPSDVRLNRRLNKIAKDFVDKSIKQPFLAVHIRSERQLAWRGIDKFLKCTNTLTKKVFKRKKVFQIKSVFLATDLPAYGSDTFQSAKSRERSLANRYVLDAFKQPLTFSPEVYGIHDKGEISIIEMNILRLGESLYTLGGGKFQDWIVDLFLAQNTEDRSLVHRVCVEKAS